MRLRGTPSQIVASYSNGYLAVWEVYIRFLFANHSLTKDYRQKELDEIVGRRTIMKHGSVHFMPKMKILFILEETTASCGCGI